MQLLDRAEEHGVGEEEIDPLPVLFTNRLLEGISRSSGIAGHRLPATAETAVAGGDRLGPPIQIRVMVEEYPPPPG